MLVVVVQLPLSSPMYDGEFDHGGGGGGGGCGGPAAAAVEAVEDNLSAKAAGIESVDGRMTACDDEIGRRITRQQPTNKQRRGGGGGSATAQGQWRGGGGSAAAAAQQLRWWRQRESGRWRQLGGGRGWRQLGGGTAALAHSATVTAWWQQHGGCDGGDSTTS